jgi:hypothetical protein
MAVEQTARSRPGLRSLRPDEGDHLVGNTRIRADSARRYQDVKRRSMRRAEHEFIGPYGLACVLAVLVAHQPL